MISFYALESGGTEIPTSTVRYQPPASIHVNVHVDMTRPWSQDSSTTPLVSIIRDNELQVIREYLKRLYSLSRVDPDVINDLLSQPLILRGVLTLLVRICECMSSIGGNELRLNEDFYFEVSRWVDSEVDGWSYLQVKVVLLGGGVMWMAKRGIDKFALLKNLTSLASQVLPKEVRQEIVVVVE